MTELQHDDTLLADLLSISGEPGDAGSSDSAAHLPLLTATQEQALLKEANQAPPPTLVPIDHTEPSAGASFVSEVAEMIRRHPLPTLLIGIGAAYLLTRRRR
jgi:hypothetical protein